MRLLSIGAFLAFLLTSASGWAQSKGPSAADKKAAKAHFDQGKSFLDAGAYDDAIREFQAAYKLVPLPQLLYNIGLAYKKKDDKKSALEYYQKFLAAVPEGEQADTARDEVAELTLKIRIEESEAARRKAEAEAAEAKRRAEEEARRRAEEEKLRRRSAQDEEEAVRRAQQRLEEQRKEQLAAEQKERERKMAEAESSGRVTRIIGWSMIGASVITGLIFWSELSKLNDANNQIDQFNNCSSCPWTTQLDQAAKDANNDGAAKGLLGTTIGLFVGGWVVYFIGSHQRSNAEEDARNWRPTSFAPEVGPHQAVMHVGWSF